MMTPTTVVGEVITRDGIARQTRLVQPEPERVGPLTYRSRPPELRRRASALRATEIRSQQAAWIGLDVEHDADRILGHVEHLELTREGSLYAVGTIFGPRPGGALYLSPATTERRDGSDLLVERIALVEDPAQICLEPVVFLSGGLDGHRSWALPERLRGLVERAARVSRSRDGSDPIRVHDADEIRAEWREPGLVGSIHERAGMGPLRYGPAMPILRVS